MKNSAIFINLGRGESVDEAAMVTALQAGAASALQEDDSTPESGDGGRVRIGMPC